MSGHDRDWRAHFKLSRAERQRGVRRVKLASTLLYAFPGSPTVYYGDEAGMEGCEDPFNRATFPWDKEDMTLLSHYRTLGQLRKERKSLRRGDIQYLRAEGGLLVFTRQYEEELTVIALNNGTSSVELDLPWAAPMAEDALTRQRFLAHDGTLHLVLPPENGMVLI